ncbi:hypothetical protein AeRB84_015089 [Aphanomyces euteiches]|nr:hypothetical protein AeRB84_015089 [Aphanomyces euteiches]
MTKEEETRKPTVKAKAVCTRWSIAYNVLFVLSLASTPFMAYITEPRPGGMAPRNPPQSDNFDEFVVATSTQREVAANAFAMQLNMTLPYEIDDEQTFNYMVRMPGPLFFGHGLRKYLMAFLTANATSRSHMQPWQMCQHDYVLTIQMRELCVWIEAIDSNQYRVWTATSIYESPSSAWIKLLFRTFVTAYVVYVLWTQYYRHYRALLTNLELHGIAADCTRYEIVVGDPSYAILSNAVVSSGMALDLLWGVSYTGIALMQVTQYQGIWLYISGCVYMARFVSFGYFSMRLMSAVIKWRRWEESFAPVDPGLLAIFAYVHCGPIISIMGSTRFVWLLYETWALFLPTTLFVPTTLEEQAIDGISGAIF